MLFKERIKHLLNKYSQKSYAQEGEDLVLAYHLHNKKTGFYIDVGAHHPMHLSNSYYFYQQGWRGINIEPMPGSLKLFNQYRPRDINLELPIAKEAKFLTYHIFNETAYNSFDKELAQSRCAINKCKMIKTIEMKTFTLAEILKSHLPPKQMIDFLTIDAEGLDLEVLESNDWEVYRPTMVLVEILNNQLENIKDNGLYQFLTNKNYKLFAKTINTYFFETL
ncbi:MAG: hypothetical protein A2381_00935 [Bdellovibrionales bacterium RIFOXYB1_FULL_37_110]|nr:MAG: hypothetical protein A2417_01790 [Bdellovibrionales bacterium RIFOXYC1_FULL_37_79]OFZ58976.1 MAG: hypothetical protein A2381_00935 [Bdellovibrionales bacterium RIFOXYB1_FULL_37_110]OFZ64863.1 MAG: hypothetical protein A2577_06935 [Bdellovibrionales bacterium RIFOXYD1_FULL_36_51]